MNEFWILLSKITALRVITRLTVHANEGKYRYSLTINDNYHTEPNKSYTYCEADLDLMVADMKRDWSHLLDKPWQPKAMPLPPGMPRP